MIAYMHRAAKCDWCLATDVDTHRFHSGSADVRSSGQICLACQIEQGLANAAPTTLRPGYVVATDIAIGRIAEIYLNHGEALLDLDDGTRAAVRLSDCTVVQRCHLPCLLWCGLTLTLDHKVIQEAA